MRQHLTVDQLEHIIEHKVLSASLVTGELESLGVVHGALLLIDKKLAGDENDDTALDHARLSIEGRHLVLDLLEGKRRELRNDGVDTESGSGLESQHRLLAVESRKCLAVSVELLVVEFNELLGNGLEISGHLDGVCGAKTAKEWGLMWFERNEKGCKSTRDVKERESKRARQL